MKNKQQLKKLWLSNNFTNCKEVGEYQNLRELKKAGKELLKNCSECANNFPAREFAYIGKDGNMIFEWIN